MPASVDEAKTIADGFIAKHFKCLSVKGPLGGHGLRLYNFFHAQLS